MKELDLAEEMAWYAKHGLWEPDLSNAFVEHIRIEEDKRCLAEITKALNELDPRRLGSDGRTLPD